MAGWTSVRRSSLKEVVIVAAALNALFVLFYLRRGDICLTQSMVLGVMFPFVIFVFERRLHSIVWHDVWRKFEKPSGPIDQVVEGMLTEASIPFERLGPWQAFRSFKFRFQERYLLEDGARITLRGQDEPVVYVGPVGMEDEVERLKDLIDAALG